MDEWLNFWLVSGIALMILAGTMRWSCDSVAKDCIRSGKTWEDDRNGRRCVPQKTER